MSETISILIDSRSRFETGQPGGEWLSMPTTTEQLHAAMKSVGITAENPQDFFIFLEGLGNFPTSKIPVRRVSGRTGIYGSGYPLPMLAIQVFSSSVLRYGS